MRKLLDQAVIGMQLRFRRAAQEFLEEERGDTNFVSIIVIIIIVMAVGIVFRQRLESFIGNIFTQLDNYTAK